MSIKIPSPSLVLNSGDWNIINFRMDLSIQIEKGDDIDAAFEDAAKRCESLKKNWKKYVTMVINCHGYTVKKQGGYGLSLGTGIMRSNVHIFGKFAPSVAKIVIVACKTAAISQPGAADGDGNLFCGEIAKHAQAKVQASQSEQTSRIIPEGKGYIDDWEGVVLTYAPDGGVIDEQRYK